MFNIRLISKGHGLGQKKLDAVQLEAAKRIINEQIPRDGKRGSTGALGKYFEIIVRFLLYKDGLKASDFRARAGGKVDFTLVINGVRYEGQIKTGDGIVTKALEPSNAPEITDADIMPDCDLIVYCTEPDELETLDDVMDNTVVVSRDEFLQVVLPAGQKRKPNWRSGVKTGANAPSLREYNKAHKGESGFKPIHDCYIMQHAYRAARWELCKSGELMSLRTFLQDIGRI